MCLLVPILKGPRAAMGTPVDPRDVHRYLEAIFSPEKTFLLPVGSTKRPTGTPVDPRHVHRYQEAIFCLEKAFLLPVGTGWNADAT